MKYILLFFILLFVGCNKNDITKSCTTENFFAEYPSRNFNMGFSTWIFAPSGQAKEDTYLFIGNNSDIYSEHIDDKIPWNAWIKGTQLPAAFTDEITSRASNRISNTQLALSVCLLNSGRSDLAEDFDGTIPNYISLNDQEIEDAYFHHLKHRFSQVLKIS